MQYQEFSNGDKMPRLGLGTWKSAPGQVHAAVAEAVRLGYRHIDCAHIYGNEPEVGSGLAEALDSGAAGRDDLWITSKLWNNSHRPEHVRPALEKTLADLRLDHLDLYLIHWPVHLVAEVMFAEATEHFIAYDALPITETWAAMEELVRAGLCRHIGVSNFTTAKLQTLLNNGSIPPAVNQVELHPYLQQPGMLEFCDKNDIHLTAYAPLGSGDRPERMRGPDDPVLLEEPALAEIAQAHDVSPAQVCIAWALARGTSVIPKSVRPERLAQNLAAKDLVLGEADMAAIAALDRHRRYVTGTEWTKLNSPYTLEIVWDGE